MRVHLAAVVLAVGLWSLMTQNLRAEGVVTPPDWLRRPTADQLRAVWPTEAWKRGQGGKAVLWCKVSLQGALFDCKVHEETPEGAGFGAAAIAMTPQLLMKPATRDGVPFVSGVAIPLTFKKFANPGPSETFGARPIAPAAMTWAAAPTHADMIANYPKRAGAARVGGRAGLMCDFLADGKLGFCQVMVEEPKGYGFGAAAKAVAKKFQAFPTTEGSRPIKDARVQLTLTFTPEMLDGSEPGVGKAQWTRTPPAEALKAAFPQDGTDVGTVRVMLKCRVEQAGKVGECKVVSETPAGKGHGDKVLPLAQHFRLATWSNEGLPIVGGFVQIPIRFEVTPPPAPKH
jgi:TonB family protein